MSFFRICGHLLWGWLSGHQHHFTLLRWDNEEACLYVECWECGHRSYGHHDRRQDAGQGKTGKTR